MNHRNIALGLAIAAYFLSFFHRVAPAAIAHELSNAFQISAASLGTLAATYFIIYTLTQVPTGILADTLGPRRILFIGGLVAGGGSLLFGLAPNFTLAFVGRTLVGLGVSVTFIAMLKLVAVWFEERRFATLTGLCMLIGNAGAIAAGAPLAWMTHLTSWRHIFVGVGILSLIIAIASLFLVRDGPVQSKQASPQGTHSRRGVWHADLRLVLGNRATWPGFFVNLGMAASFFSFAGLWAQLPEIELRPGMTITQSCRIKPGQYKLAVAPGDTSKGQIQVRGHHITVDFQQADLSSGMDSHRPDLFRGIAIDISGADIEVKNVRVRGFKIALLASEAPRLRLENSDFSYNYRPRLLSGREREDESDWLSYHHNERDEWMRYGAGLYLNNCDGAVVRGCRITGCQNALLMTRSDSCLIYNNAFQFNSGLGVGLYRSSHNRLMHNKLDWNVRGYSHGFYARGQDSAGILLYEQSSNNLIAYNSATHCGDGLFLWAGQSTMDSGQGGCNDNYIFGNDFSHAPTNGIEVTFSRNNIRGNILRECTYGIWGGYSFGSTIMGNYMAECQYGIAIEHGQDNVIRQNLFQDDTIGIQLWARDKQPQDWGYAQKRDTRSRNCKIDRNVFLNTRKPLKINASSSVAVNGENLFFDFERLLETTKSNDSLTFLRNDIYGSTAEIAETWSLPDLQKSRSLNFSHPDKNPENPFAPLDIPLIELNEPDSLPDGILAALPPKFPRGRQFIMVGEWGPFDFRRPEAILDTLAGRQYSLVLLGPSGDWQVKSMQGVKNISARKGIVPATLTFERDPDSPSVNIEFSYTSPQAITTVHGERIPSGQVYLFDFHYIKKE